jgi:hypothetical protein
MNALKPMHIRALQLAIDEAAVWRGTLMGNPDETDLEEFDKFIATAQTALDLVKVQQREIKAINKAERS